MSIKTRIVFSDVDGTLLSKNRELSSATIYQIRKLIEHKIIFVMVSARMPEGMKHLYKAVPLNSPVISYNGALILKSIDDGLAPHNILFSKSISYSVVRSIYHTCQAFDLHFSLYSNNLWFASKSDEWRLREENNTKVTATILSDMGYKIAELEKQQQHIHKVMVMGQSMLIDGLINNLTSQYTGKVNIYRSKDTYIEITPSGITKASGCQILLNDLGISPEQAIAFGDNHNDTEMLEMVGIGIAMENAPEEVKVRAKRVAPANTHDGVAKVLEEILTNSHVE